MALAAHSDNIDALDGVRGLAALVVLASHMSSGSTLLDFRGSGQLGVMLFYVLSGSGGARGAGIPAPAAGRGD